MAAQVKPKTKKIQCYYAESVRVGKFDTFKQRFIHKKDNGFWAFVRDVSQNERIQNQTINVNVSLIFVVNFNKRIIDMYSKGLRIIFDGRTYEIVAKPDEYEYQRGDLHILALEFIDNTVYDEVIYDED